MPASAGSEVGTVASGGGEADGPAASGAAGTAAVGGGPGAAASGAAGDVDCGADGTIADGGTVPSAGPLVAAGGGIPGG
jgi:hypothetical protein